MNYLPQKAFLQTIVQVVCFLMRHNAITDTYEASKSFYKLINLKC